ncbi:MAG TPA: OmpH family outer membrane protein [Planctomycetota bacterium]|nr:OmpH family outer membrane protein [Planctomycetota bacterium]
MSTHPFWISALLVATGSLLVAQDHSAAATEGATKKVAPVSIGVVDLAKALEAYPKQIKMEQELKTLQDVLKEELGKIEASINETRENIKAVGENSEEGKDRMFQYDGLRQLWEFKRKRMVEKLEIAEMRMKLELYEDMEVAVAKVAKNRGVQLVVRTYDPGPPPNYPDKASNKELGQMNLRLQMFDRRQVWYNTDEIDLTGDLIKLLKVPLEKDAPAKTAEPPKTPAKPERGGG